MEQRAKKREAQKGPKRNEAMEELRDGSLANTGTSSCVYIGFGTAQSGVLFDTIIVEDDDHWVPVELCGFMIE